MSDDYEECDFSGLAKAFCAHCKGHTLGDERTGPATYADLTDEYERTGRRFEAKYSGRCVVDIDHRVKVGDLVSRVQRIANPFIAISGVACKACTADLRHADGE